MREDGGCRGAQVRDAFEALDEAFAREILLERLAQAEQREGVEQNEHADQARGTDPELDPEKRNVGPLRAACPLAGHCGASSEEQQRRERV